MPKQGEKARKLKALSKGEGVKPPKQIYCIGTYIHDMPKRDITSKEYGYIAGLIDGEGTIDIRYRKERNNYAVPRIRIGNTNFEMMNWLNDSFKGRVGKIKRYNPNWKQGYSFTIEKRSEIKNILTNTIDLLIEKRQKANELLDFIENTTKRVRE